MHQCWSVSPSYSTIALAPSSILMMLAVNYLPREEGQWMLLLQLKQFLCSTSEEQSTKVGKMLQVCLDMPTPGNRGWVDPKNWKPLLTTLLEASVSLRELLCCSCKKGCTAGRSKCKKAALNCTALCQCAL